jgi:flagellar basal-body rod protein FlgC
MGLLDVFKIGASGMRAQRMRMEVIATNLANIHTTRTEDGGPFVKKEVVFKQTDVSEKPFRTVLSEKIDGVVVDDVQESDKPFEKVHDPGHPDADGEGYVTLPNVNLMEEMADMIAATRAYEANINVINTTKEMALKTLEIGR